MWQESSREYYHDEPPLYTSPTRQEMNAELIDAYFRLSPEEQDRQLDRLCEALESTVRSFEII